MAPAQDPHRDLHRTCVRAVRGATTVPRDEAALVCGAIHELLAALLTRNGLAVGDIVSAMFTATADLHSVFPARAAREIGWTDVPMLCATEMDISDALPRCLRVLLHVERTASAPKLTPVYLHEAVVLRPDHGGSQHGCPDSPPDASSSRECA